MDSSTSTYHQKRGHMFFLEHSVYTHDATYSGIKITFTLQLAAQWCQWNSY